MLKFYITAFPPIIFLLSLTACLPKNYLNESTANIEFPCKYHEGKSNILIVGSSLLLADEVQNDGGVAIGTDGKIQEVGKFSEVKSSFPNADVLDCRGNTILSPGWVNVHEHEAFSYTFPDEGLAPVYNHRDEWISGYANMPSLPIPAAKLYADDNKKNAAVLAWVELRHLMSGTTSLGGPGAVPGIVRNINVQKNEEDALLYPLEANLEIFPFTFTASDLFLKTCRINRLSEVVEEHPKPKVDDAGKMAYSPHLGEGRKTNCTARSEINAYIDFVSKQKGINRRYSIVHAVAASPQNFKSFSELDISLVWSPRSNLSLYGETIDLQESKNKNIRLALSTDWSPSGSFNMLEEFECARQASQLQNVTFNSHELWAMATLNAAYAVGLDDKIGQIKTELFADLVLISTSPNRIGYEAAVTASVKDVLIVWVGGDPLILRSDFSHKMKNANQCLPLPTTDKHTCISFESLGVKLEELEPLNKNYVPINGNATKQTRCNSKL